MRLVAVTKTHPVETIREAIAAGLREFGENRIQEALPKIESLQADPLVRGAQLVFHLIGHLQTNKAKQALRNFAWIHSVDSLKLAAELQRHAESENLTPKILVEVNVAGEDSKFGITPEQAPDICARIIEECPRLQVEGLMTVAPLTAAPEECRTHFARLREISRQIQSETGPNRHFGKELSMGMTSDFEVAIEEGATMVRIGSAIFGARG